MTSISQEKDFYKTITGKKILNQKMADRLYKLGYQGRSVRMRECMNTIEYTKCNVCGEIHILQTNRCRDRFCALCQTQLARKRFSEMTQVYDMIKPIIEGTTTAMLTLTIKNCYVDDLKQTIKEMNKAFKRLKDSALTSPLLRAGSVCAFAPLARSAPLARRPSSAWLRTAR